MVWLNFDDYYDYWGYVGCIVGGIFKKGDDVMLLFFGFISKIKKIDIFDGEVDEVYLFMLVIFLLEDDLDLSWGDMIVWENN